jgi:hypothetical protein
MALCCLLVAFMVCGIPEVLDGQANSSLYCAGKSDDVAARILALLNDPERAAQLGKQAPIDSQLRLPLKSGLRGQRMLMARLSSESDRGNEQAVMFSCRFRSASG